MSAEHSLPPRPPAAGRRWTFLTNHARVLITVARNPSIRVRDISQMIGITERATQAILTDLEEAGFLDKERVGRRNQYSVHPSLSFRHPLEGGHEVGELIALFADGESSRPGQG